MNKIAILTGAVMMFVSLNNSMAVDLIKNGKPQAKIYHAPLPLSSQAKDLVKNQKFSQLSSKELRNFWKLAMDAQDRLWLINAITDLNDHLKKMSGAKLEVVITDNPSEVKTPAVVIGTLANKMGAEPSLKTESKEAFRLKAGDQKILISGESDLGAVYGIYEMLNRLGCDWVFPGKEGEIIPKKKTVALPSMDLQEEPSFPVHSGWYSGYSRGSKRLWPDFFIWQLRQKQQILKGVRPMAFKAGGHVWKKLIRKYKKEFDANPEMLALRRLQDGSMKRMGPQIETTNPAVIDLAIRYIREMFEKNGWAKDKKVCISVGPADGGGMSESPESLATGTDRFDPRSGRRDGIDLLVLFCNKILEKIGDEYPNLHLGFFLYSWHADYPMRYRPHPRIVIELADINYSRLHGLKDKSSKSRAYYADVLKQWSRLHDEQGNVLQRYVYGFNLADGFLPFSKLKIWGEDFPRYQKLGFTTLRMNMGADWAVNGAHYYLGTKLNWNTSQDWKQILRRYCELSFGKGAPFMEKYFLMLSKQQSEKGMEAGSYFSYNLIYDQKFIQKAEELFTKAERAAEDPLQKKRIQYAKVPLDNLKLYLAYRDAYSRFDFAAAQKIFKKMIQHIDDTHARNEQLIGYMAKMFLTRLLKPFIDESVKYSTGKYKIVYKIPDQLKTAIDQYMTGQNMRYYGTKINDENYFLTRTYTSTWDAQGLAGYRRGAVWYRIPFKLPEDLKGKPIGLFIGGADNAVRVWCNEKYIGSGSGYISHPQLFDLTDAVDTGKKNLLAFQVLRTSNNELGSGGLMYPSFIFTGPRLEKPAPNKKKPTRMLPGGIIVKK